LHMTNVTLCISSIGVRANFGTVTFFVPPTAEEGLEYWRGFPDA